MTADLPDDLDLLSRPVTYLSWAAQSTDKQKHEVSVYFDARSEIAVNTADQAVTFQNADVSHIKAWRVGTVEQPVLQKKEIYPSDSPALNFIDSILGKVLNGSLGELGLASMQIIEAACESARTNRNEKVRPHTSALVQPSKTKASAAAHATA